VLERFPELFAQKLLRHLDPIDRTFLAQAGGGCRAAVEASDLPRAGTRRVVVGRSVRVVQHRLGEFVGSVKRLPVGCADLCASPLGAVVWRCCVGRGSTTDPGMG